MGVKEFHAWSERLISGALLQGGKDDPEAFIKMQKFALASMLMHLGPTESHKPDAHFIHSLRHQAAKEIAYQYIQDIQEEKKKKIAEEDSLMRKEAMAKLEADLVKDTPLHLVEDEIELPDVDAEDDEECKTCSDENQ